MDDHVHVHDHQLLEQLSDESLLEYIADLSWAQSQCLPQGLSQGLSQPALQPGQAPDAYTRDQYFTDKAARQQQQDLALRDENRRAGTPQLFAGCSVYVNGYTKPGRPQLHDLLVKHGGEFVHYLTAKGRVTHIVASNLPLKKRKEFAHYKVVTPEWLVESVDAGRLLPWQSYAQVWDSGQPKLQVTSCNDPDFLKHFFRNSRLHHLSDWKADLRQNFLALNDQMRVPRKGDKLLVFHIDFDCFFAAVAALDFPHLDITRDPIVVCHGTNNSDIASCNYVARRYGLKNGMWVSGAKKRLPKDVTLHCLPYNFQEIKAKSVQFYNILKKNGSIKFDEILPISIDESICVRIARDDADPPPDLEQVCKGLRAEIFSATSCSVSVGCSDTLILSRLNLKNAKPDNFFIQLQQDLDDSFLSQISVTDIPGVGASTLAKLNSISGEGRAGIPNALELKKMIGSSKKTLVGPIGNKIGAKLARKIQLSLEGKDDDESLKMIYEPSAYFERKSISIDINWGIRFNSIHEVDSFIDVCTRYLMAKLQELRRKTSQIGLKIMKRAKDAPIEPAKYLGSGACDSMSRNSKLGMPTDEFGLLTTETKNSFRCLSCPPNEVRGISIQFNKLVDADFSQNKTSKRFVNSEDFHNLPNDVKPSFANELKRRKIHIKELKVNPYQEKFLSEIPTQFRNEIKKDLLIEEKIKNSKVSEFYEKRVKRQTLLENSKNHLLGNNNESLFESIKFQNEKCFKNICSQLIEWVDFTIFDNGPHSKDLALFENYLDKLSDSNRLPLILRISKLISTELNLKSSKCAEEKGFLEWEKVLINIIIPKLNKNKHTFQTVRKLDLEFDI